MKKSIVLYLFLTIYSILQANTEHSFFYHFDHLRIEQGLSHLDINDITSDENGFMWFTTLNGLCRYDGYQIQAFRLAGNNTMNRNRMTSIIDIGNNIFLIGSESGLFAFNRRNEEFITLQMADSSKNFILNESIQLYLIDQLGQIWCSYNNELLVFTQENLILKILSEKNELLKPEAKPDLIITDIVIDKAQNYWICSNDGVFHIAINSDHTLELIKHLHTASNIQNYYDNYVTAAYINTDGDLILGNYQAYHFVDLEYPENGQATKIKQIEFLTTKNQRVINIFNQQNSTALGVVRDIQQDQFDNLWLGFDNGLVKIAKYEDMYESEFLLYQKSQDKPYSLSSNNINVLYLNRDGCLFLGTYGGGVNILDTKQKRIFLLRSNLEKKEQSLSDHFIRDVAEDDAENLWIGTQSKGIDFYDAKLNQTTNYMFEDKTDAATRNSVRCIYLEKNRWLWIGTLSEVLCFDTQTRKLHTLPGEFTQATSISVGYISDIATDKHGNLWISTWRNGLMFARRSTDNPFQFDYVKHFNTQQPDSLQLQSDIVNYIHTGKSANEVMVSTQKGFAIIHINTDGDPTFTTQFLKAKKQNESLTNLFVWDIVEINDSTYYMGTLGGGVNKVHIDRKQTMTTEGNYKAEALPLPPFIKLSNIECLLSDNKQNLWIAGNGIYLFNTQENKLELLDFKKSIFGNQFKVGGTYLGKSGKIYFSGVNGISFFAPHDISPNTKAPSPEFTQFEIHNIPIEPEKAFNNHVVLEYSLPYTHRIKLHHTENNFTIHFSAMQFEDPLQVHYKYKLDGFDQKWVFTTGNEAKVTYSNLKYRTYTFDLYASNNDGIWSTVPKKLTITVVPPWYRSKVALLAYIILGLMVLVSIFIYQRKYYQIKNALEIQQIDEKKKEELFQEKMRFFTNISHELRTPLTLMISPLYDLVASEQRTKVKSQLNFIYRNAERMLHHVNELIKFRRAELGIDTLKTIETDVNPFLKSIGESFNDWALRKQITYDIKLLNEPLTCWIDRDKCETIIYNLLTNSFKHTHDGGHIRLAAQMNEIEIPFREMKKSIEIGTKKTDWQYLKILVSDNGTGIPEDNLDTIFERFYQGKENKQGGFGIGLSLVKNNILQHKGSIEVFSGQNMGTDMLIHIPLNDDAYIKSERINVTVPDTKRIKVDPEIIFTNSVSDEVLLSESDEKLFQKQRLSNKKETILIIEDDEQILNYLRINLSRFYTVLVANNGENGLIIISDKLPDIIICDVMLPGIDGFEICKRIKLTKETAHIPVVMLTAKTDLQDKMTGAKVGADVYIEKPFSVAYLLTEIYNILENRKKLIDKISKNVIFESHKKATDSKEEEFVNKLVKTIEQLMDQPNFSVDLICRELGIARSNFYIKVKESIGKTPNDFIKDVRLDYAVNLLVNENMPITETAYRIGMTPTFFSKAFKDKFNKTPSAYLNKIKNL